MTDRTAPFVGRSKELKLLNQLKNKKISSLVVIKGRRRVGKSRLIQEFAKGSNFYEFSGLSPDKKITAEQQREHFASQLSARTGRKSINANDWNFLFNELANEVEGKKCIILFDEISWLGSKDETFLGKLKTAWDTLFKKNPQLILVLCGSVSAWIEKNILRSQLFLGRVSLPITLKELSVPICKALLVELGGMFSNYELFKILSVTGGIPRYLEEIQTNQSAEENIKRLCFTETGILVHEFKDIFTDIFTRRNEIYKKIIEFLAQKSATVHDISEVLKVEQGGYLSDCLEELCEAEIINRHFTWSIVNGKESNLSQYALRDNYMRFYLKYIEQNLSKIKENHYESLSLNNLSGWSTIAGLQFQNLVLNNRDFILQKLNANRANIINDNPFFQRKTQRRRGCQIDYLIQTRENILYICEIKFSRHEIKSDIIDEMKTKLNNIEAPKGFALLPVLVHVNGVSESLLDSNYFYSIIDFSELL